MRYSAVLLEAVDADDYLFDQSYKNLSKDGVTLQATLKHIDMDGPIACIVDILASNDNEDFFQLTTFDLNGKDVVSDGFCSNSSWPFYRADLKSITSNSTVKVTIGMK